MVLNVRVTREGDVEQAEIVSRVGGGLDEQARKAVLRWHFQPARVGGHPVPAWTVVKVNFRLAGEWFDARQEKLRTEFATALKQFEGGVPGVGRKRLETLAAQHYPPAVHWLGQQWEERDPARAARLYAEAAAKNWAPAVFDEGRLRVAAGDESGVARVTEASVLGHEDAREWLGRYWAPREAAKARRYFRLCAMAGRAECQWELARLMWSTAEKLQGLAWLELAAAQGHAPAQEALRVRRTELSDSDQSAVLRHRDALTALAGSQ